MSFKRGDRVKWIEKSTGYMTKNKSYEVIKYEEDGSVHILDDVGDRDYYNEKYFVLSFVLSKKRTKKDKLKEQEKLSKQFLVLKKSCMNFVGIYDTFKKAKNEAMSHDDEHLVYECDLKGSNQIKKMFKTFNLKTFKKVKKKKVNKK